MTVLLWLTLEIVLMTTATSSKGRKKMSGGYTRPNVYGGDTLLEITFI